LLEMLINMYCKRASHAPRQQLHGIKVEPYLAAGDGCLEILGQPPVAAKPGKGSLDHPTPWQHLKTLGLVRSLDDLERPLPVPEKSGLQFLAGVGAIGKDMPQPREEIADRGQDLRGAIAILDISSMHLHANQMPRRYR
jgi:hypothetical protein